MPWLHGPCQALPECRANKVRVVPCRDCLVTLSCRAKIFFQEKRSLEVLEAPADCQACSKQFFLVENGCGFLRMSKICLSSATSKFATPPLPPRAPL